MEISDLEHLDQLFDDAAAALAEGDTRQATMLLRRLVSDRPTDIEAIRQLARLYRDDGRLDATDAFLVSALEINSASVELMLELADLRLAQGDPQGASEPIRRALALQPNHSETLYLLGNAFMDLEHHAEALRAFRSSLDSDPFSAATWYNVALACHETGDGPGEIEALEAYLRCEPGAEDRGAVEALVQRLSQTLTNTAGAASG